MPVERANRTWSGGKGSCAVCFNVGVLEFFDRRRGGEGGRGGGGKGEERGGKEREKVRERGGGRGEGGREKRQLLTCMHGTPTGLHGEFCSTEKISLAPKGIEVVVLLARVHCYYMSSLLRWMKTMIDYGLCLLTGLPTEEGSVYKVMNRLLLVCCDFYM